MSGVEKMSIALTPEIAAFVREAVETGEYASSSEVVRDGLRRLKERHDLFGYTLEELRQLVQEGLDSGPALDGETVIRELRERIRRKRAPSSA